MPYEAQNAIALFGYILTVASSTAFLLWIFGIIRLPERRQEDAPVPQKTWIRSETVVGTLLFESHGELTKALGIFGELMTRLIMTGHGYSEIPTHYSGNQGIDHLFVRSDLKAALDRGEGPALDEIIIVESKANDGQLDPPQMWDEWIKSRIEQLWPDSPNDAEKLDHIKEAVRNALQNKGPRLRRQLFRHRLATGLTIIEDLDREARPLSAGVRLTGAIRSVLQTVKDAGGYRWEDPPPAIMDPPTQVSVPAAE